MRLIGMPGSDGKGEIQPAPAMAGCGGCGPAVAEAASVEEIADVTELLLANSPPWRGVDGNDDDEIDPSDDEIEEVE